MDDGGRIPQSGQLAEAGVPLVVSELAAGGGLGLMVIALFAYLKASLPRLARAAVWLLRGREGLERRLVAAGIGPALSLSPRLDGLIERAAAGGRPVYLASRRCSPLLQELSARHPALAGAIIVPCGLNSRRGAAELLDRFPQGYDALLQRHGTMRVVRHAPAGALVGEPQPDASEEASEPQRPPASVVREMARSLRPHQCVKNVVVFVPLVLSGRFTVPAEVVDTLLAFIALSVIAAGTYIFNDIWDVAEDRAHWSKKERPIASGRLSAATALAAAAILIPAGLALAGLLVSWWTCAALLVYLALTLAYSLHLKSVPFLDGLVLAALFTVRLGIGVVAADTPPTAWLFVFSMLLFGSLSYAKRHTEICRAMVNESNALNGRGYRPADAPMVLSVGISAGVGAVMIMVLYIVEEAFLKSFYGTTAWLWGFPPLIFLFVVRVWLVTVRGEMTDDPVAFAIRDRACIGLLALLTVCFGFAWLG